MSVVGKNLVWLLLSQAATWILTLLTIVVVPRIVGVPNFGTVAVAGVFVQYFALIAGFEFAPVITRTIARHPSALGSYVLNSTVFRLVTVTLVSLGATGLAVLIGLDRQTVVLIAIGFSGMLIANVNNVLVAALAGIQRMGRPAMWATVQMYVGGFLAVAVVAAGGDVYAYVAVGAVAGMIPLVANWTQVRAFVRPRPTLDRSVWRSLFRGGLPLVVLAALTQFYGNVDFMVLDWFGGDTAVGWYFIAYKWAGISFFICTAVVAAYFPRFSELAPAGGRPFADATNKALSLVVLVAVPFAFGLAAVADDLVRFLYDDDVLPAVPVMRILALQLPVTAVNTVLSSALMAAERVRGFIYVSLIACVLTPLSCILTVRAFVDGPSKGAVGAALVTTLTEVFVLGGGYILRPSGVLDRATIGRCLRAVMAGAAMFDVLWILDDLPFIVKPLVGIVVYGAVAIALGIVAIRDLTEGANYVGRVIRRRDDTAQAVEQVEQIDHG